MAVDSDFNNKRTSMKFRVTFSDGESDWKEVIEADNEPHLYIVLDGMCEDVVDIEEME